MIDSVAQSSGLRSPQFFPRQCAKLGDSYGTRTEGRVSNIYMRYWGYLVAKLTVAGAILLVLRQAIVWMFHPARFALDLAFTFAMLLFTLFATGLLWLIVWDQRYRCRSCLRRLCMPVATGSWTHILFIGTPRTEYICPYGHGTLKVAELQITGRENPDWQPHEDIWEELYSLEGFKFQRGSLLHLVGTRIFGKSIGGKSMDGKSIGR